MAKPINVPIKLKVTFDQAGNPQIKASGGGQGPAAVNQQGAGGKGGGGGGGGAGMAAVGGPAGGQMGTQHRIAFGGVSGMPWWLDPSSSLGSSLRAMTSTMMDPMMSGGEQTATMAAQSARMGVSAFGRSGAGRAMIQPFLGSPTADTDAIWDALADTLAAAIEKGFQEVSVTSQQTNQQVGDVAARFARAGMPLEEERLTSFAGRMQKLNRAEYRARVMAAKATGNVTAGLVGEAQAAVGDLVNPINNGSLNPTTMKMLQDMMAGEAKATIGQLGGS